MVLSRSIKMESVHAHLGGAENIKLKVITDMDNLIGRNAHFPADSKIKLGGLHLVIM